MMTLQDLACFLSVAETQNFTKTAEQLYTSQPAVSRHIKSLEEEFDTPLVERNNRKSLHLTEPGVALYECLKRCSEDFEKTRKHIGQFSQKLPITVNLPKGTLLPDGLINIFYQFIKSQEKNPVWLETEFINYDEYSTVLDNGEILICTEDTLNFKKKYDIHTLSIQAARYYVMTSARNGSLANEKATLRDYLEHPIYLPRSMPKTLMKDIMDTVTSILGHKPKEVDLLNSFDSVLLYLRDANSVTIGHQWTRGFSDGSTAAVPFPMSTRYVAVWDPDRIHNQKTRTLLRMLCDAE